MVSNPGQPAGGRKTGYHWPVIFVVAVVVGFLAWQFRPARLNEPNGGPGHRRVKLTDSDCQRLTALKNIGLGHLENFKTDEAIDVLAKLVQELPDEPAALQALVVAELLAIAGGRDSDGLSTRLKTLIERLPQSAVPRILAARVAEERGNKAIATGDDEAATALAREALSQLEKAGEIYPSDASIWNAAYNLVKISLASTQREKQNQFLGKAYAAAPDNLYLASEWLVAQAQTKDSAISGTLRSLHTLVQPILKTVPHQSKDSGITELMDQAQSAIEAGDWKLAATACQKLQNVLKPDDWWKSDQNRLKPHSLTYVDHHFASLDCAESPPASASGLSAVRLVKSADPSPFDQLAGVRDLLIGDVDLDGRFEIVTLTDSALTVFKRDHTTAAWTQMLLVEVPGPMRGLLAADLDREGPPAAKKPLKPVADKPEEPQPSRSSTCRDADLDFVVFGPAGVQVFRNEMELESTDRRLVAIEQPAELAAVRDVLAAALADIDHDGDLDLVISSSAGFGIWANQGDGRFFDISIRSQLPPGGKPATSLATVDLDRDFDIDVIVAGPAGLAIGILENMRHGVFRWRPLEGEFATLGESRWVVVIDDDSNGSWDLVGAGPEGVKRVGTTLAPAAGAVPIGSSSIGKRVVERLISCDFDNDSLSDLVAYGASGLTLFRGLGAGKYADETGLVDPQPQSVVAAAVGDLDGDGDWELVVAEPARVTIYNNEGGNQNHWIDLRVLAEDDQKSNRVNQLGIGSVIELKAGPVYREQIITGQVTHIGLGQRTAVDVIRIVWTSGVPQVVMQPVHDAPICELHRADMPSCPFLYYWNGTEFVFATDLLWNSPIGLQFAEGVLAQPRPWEYIKVSGNNLKAKEGRYVFQITGDLWEAEYFDHLSLIAVDHPADVEIFSNEKVGPAEIAEFKVHTVRERRPPVAARNARGEDVLDTIVNEDGVFLKGHTLNHAMGLTDDHFLELDLGNLHGAQQIRLFLTGWIHPSDTSVRVGSSQNPHLPKASPPSLWVPDEHGTWQRVRPYMGFPGGKTKTIAIDLSGVFLCDDFRVRIATNFEIYWDAAFFTADEQPAEVQLQPLSVAAADLHFRGRSNVVIRSGYGPQFYDYNDVRTEPHHPPMGGFFTRYGDVTELLTAADDRQVILGSGDELTVQFDLPAEPPTGWKRDFLLYSVGYDKDGVLNTVYGQTVEPLPFRGMSRYPYGPDEQFPQTSEHLAYLKKYQTRTQKPVEFWRRIREFSPSSKPNP